jgi:hypothetical protein
MRRLFAFVISGWLAAWGNASAATPYVFSIKVENTTTRPIRVMTFVNHPLGETCRPSNDRNGHLLASKSSTVLQCDVGFTNYHERPATLSPPSKCSIMRNGSLYEVTVR